MWKIDEHNQRENDAYINGRAGEWGHFTVFATEIFMPLLFLVLKWYFVILIVIVLDWIWSLIRYRYFNINISEFFWKLNRFKFPILIIISIIFFLTKRPLEDGFLTLAWPFISLIIFMIGPPANMELLKASIEKRLNQKESNQNSVQS
jgi:hypothetical protein